MNVLGLFNGMNTGREALDQLDINVDKYYSSELKKYAIELTQHHYPDTVQLGNILNWRDWSIEWGNIDLILSGSPCKDLSAAGKRAGIYGKNSGLFWVFIDILNHVKKLNPDVLFLQENVGSAPKLDIGIMSRALGVYPVRINSNLLTAQNRDRYYWSNIKTKKDGLFGDVTTDIPQPVDKKIMLKDIITHGYVEKNKAGCLMQSDVKHLINDEKKQQIYIDKRIKKGRQIPNIVYAAAKRGRKNTDGKIEQTIEINNSGKSNYIKTVSKDSLVYFEGNEPLFCIDNSNIRTLNKIELCRLQGFPDNYCDILTRNKAASLLGDGWTLPVIIHILKYLK